MYKITDRIFESQEDYWFLKMFNIINTNHPQLLHEYFDYLNDHWELINNWISIEAILSWENFLKRTNHTQLMRKVTAIKEYRDARKNGLKNNQSYLFLKDSVQSISENRNGNNKWDDYNEYSDLRKFGYKVEKGTTIEERRNALRKAMKHIPLSKIQNFIHLRLKNSYKKNGVYGDYSNSINAYEMDLEYLQEFFDKNSSV